MGSRPTRVALLRACRVGPLKAISFARRPWHLAPWKSGVGFLEWKLVPARRRSTLLPTLPSQPSGYLSLIRPCACAPMVVSWTSLLLARARLAVFPRSLCACRLAVFVRPVRVEHKHGAFRDTHCVHRGTKKCYSTSLRNAHIPKMVLFMVHFTSARHTERKRAHTRTSRDRQSAVLVVLTPPPVGPWCRRNLIPRRPNLGKNQTWLPDPNPKPPPAGFGVGIAWSDANPHPGPLPLGR